MALNEPRRRCVSDQRNELGAVLAEEQPPMCSGKPGRRGRERELQQGLKPLFRPMCSGGRRGREEEGEREPKSFKKPKSALKWLSTKDVCLR